jgi:hypothetical protein
MRHVSLLLPRAVHAPPRPTAPLWSRSPAHCSQLAIPLLAPHPCTIPAAAPSTSLHLDASCQDTGAAVSVPSSSSSELPHPWATGPEAALKSPDAVDSNHRRGHPHRRVAPAIPRPNWHLQEDRTHTSHLPDRSTPFLHRLSNRMPVSTPASTSPLWIGSSGEHLPALSPKMGSPQCRTPPWPLAPLSSAAVCQSDGHCQRQPPMQVPSPVSKSGYQPQTLMGQPVWDQWE